MRKTRPQLYRKNPRGKINRIAKRTNKQHLNPSLMLLHPFFNYTAMYIQCIERWPRSNHLFLELGWSTLIHHHLSKVFSFFDFICRLRLLDQSEPDGPLPVMTSGYPRNYLTIHSFTPIFIFKTAMV